MSPTLDFMISSLHSAAELLGEQIDFLGELEEIIANQQPAEKGYPCANMLKLPYTMGYDKDTYKGYETQDAILRSIRELAKDREQLKNDLVFWLEEASRFKQSSVPISSRLSKH